MCSMVKREMTITHEEFLRVFTTAFTKEIIAQGLDFFVIDVDGKEVRIHLNPEKRKKIASLEWIVTDVDLAHAAFLTAIL